VQLVYIGDTGKYECFYCSKRVISRTVKHEDKCMKPAFDEPTVIKLVIVHLKLHVVIKLKHIIIPKTAVPPCQLYAQPTVLRQAMAKLMFLRLTHYLKLLSTQSSFPTYPAQTVFPLPLH
jgi:hypothetical protein